MVTDRQEIPPRVKGQGRGCGPAAGSPVTPIPGTLKLVKNAVTLIQGAELTPQVVVDLVRRGNKLVSGHK